MNYQRIDARTGFIYAHLSLKGILVQLADTTHARWNIVTVSKNVNNLTFEYLNKINWFL